MNEPKQDMLMRLKRNKEAQEAFRERQRALGRLQLNMWVAADAITRVKQYIKRANEKSLAARGDRTN